MSNIVRSDDSMNSYLEVVNVGVSASKFIAEYLTTSVVKSLGSAIDGIKIAIYQSEVEITYRKQDIRTKMRTSYKIACKSELCYKYSRAIDQAENDPRLRPEIRAKLMEELNTDLAEDLALLRLELNKIAEALKNDVRRRGY